MSEHVHVAVVVEALVAPRFGCDVRYVYAFADAVRLGTILGAGEVGPHSVREFISLVLKALRGLWGCIRSFGNVSVGFCVRQCRSPVKQKLMFFFLRLWKLV